MPPTFHNRRSVLAGAGASFGLAGFAPTGAAASHADDWRWLVGAWDVRHRRLQRRLEGSHDWDEFAGRSAFWLTMGGLGNIDDNELELPAGRYRALSVRAFDPKTSKWSIWWLDARNLGTVDPPERGAFKGEDGLFYGPTVSGGRPVKVRYHWREIHGRRPWWEQAFSPDDGRTWEVNWLSWITRTSATPAPLPARPGERAPGDFDFLRGRWTVHNRRLRQPLAQGEDWEAFGGEILAWPVLAGSGAVADTLFSTPAGERRGMSVRAYDPDTKRWASWWVDQDSGESIGAPLRGAFSGGEGMFEGEDMRGGRPVRVRNLWSHVTGSSARWEEALSTDGGSSWRTTWTAELSRTA
jgi:hypothetical protein